MTRHRNLSGTDRAGSPAAADRWRVTDVDFRAPLVALALTTALAGVVDAFAFLRYTVFVGMQTGNMAFLGIGLAGRLEAWPAALASIVAFSLGGITGARIRRLPVTGPFSPPILELLAMLVLIVIWGVADLSLNSGRDALAQRVLLTALGGFPIGILAGLTVRTFGVRTSTSYQTSNLLRTTQGIADWAFGHGDVSRARHMASLGLLCLVGYAAGAAVGTATEAHPFWVFVISVLLVGVLISITRHGAPGTTARQAPPPPATP